jgi:hypothetical protein
MISKNRFFTVAGAFLPLSTIGSAAAEYKPYKGEQGVMLDGSGEIIVSNSTILIAG